MNLIFMFYLNFSLLFLSTLHDWELQSDQNPFVFSSILFLNSLKISLFVLGSEIWWYYQCLSLAHLPSNLSVNLSVIESRKRLDITPGSEISSSTLPRFSFALKIIFYLWVFVCVAIVWVLASGNLLWYEKVCCI